jgi:hypothetical protein
MYISGTKYDLERRIHQLCTTPSDYTDYQTEFAGYTFTGQEIHIENRINKEFTKKSSLAP